MLMLILAKSKYNAKRKRKKKTLKCFHHREGETRCMFKNNSQWLDMLTILQESSYSHDISNRNLSATGSSES